MVHELITFNVHTYTHTQWLAGSWHPVSER